MDIVESTARKINPRAFVKMRDRDQIDKHREAYLQAKAKSDAVKVLKIVLLNRGPTAALDMAKALAPHLYGGASECSDESMRLRLWVKTLRARRLVENLAMGIYCEAIKVKDLRQQLIARELEGWRDLGVPVDEPELKRTVESKYK